MPLTSRCEENESKIQCIKLSQVLLHFKKLDLYLRPLSFLGSHKLSSVTLIEVIG